MRLATVLAGRHEGQTVNIENICALTGMACCDLGGNKGMALIRNEHLKGWIPVESVGPHRRYHNRFGGNKKMNTFCPECGPRVPIDEDGCCVYCGATAVGAAVDRVMQLTKVPLERNNGN